MESLDRADRSTLSSQLLQESEAMTKHALASGLDVPPPLVQKLETVLLEVSRDESPLASAEEEAVRQLTAIHGRLAKIIAPATPRTILLLASDSKKVGIWRFLGAVPLIRRMMLAAILSLLALVFLSLSPHVNVKTMQESLLTSSGEVLFHNLLFLMAAAALGASFASLFQANRFIEAGTFDPIYESSYWIRFVLGLIAGIILAELIPLGTDGTLQAFTKPTLSMLGGFSSAVVYRLIHRLLQAVESLVRGETGEIRSARESEARARAAQKNGQVRLELAATLLKLQLELRRGGSPEEVQQKLDRTLTDLLSSRAEWDDGSESEHPMPS